MFLSLNQGNYGKMPYFQGSRSQLKLQAMTQFFILIVQEVIEQNVKSSKRKNQRGQSLYQVPQILYCQKSLVSISQSTQQTKPNKTSVFYLHNYLIKILQQMFRDPNIDLYEPQERLLGQWDDDCPFEFTYEDFVNMPAFISYTKNQKINASLHAKIHKNRIEVYNDQILIKQIQIQGPNLPFESFQKALTLEYLCLFSENEIYYFSLQQNQGELFTFSNGLIIQFLYENSCLNLVILRNQNLELHRIDQSFEIKLIKQIKFDYNIVDQGVKARHHLGFFKIEHDQLSLISNKLLKPICAFKKEKFNLTIDEDEYFIRNQYEELSYLMDDILLLDIQMGRFTIMSQLRNGKTIRKIKHCCYAQLDLYSKQIFKHFMLISTLQSTYYNILDIYDFIKGRYVASVYYQAYKSIEVPTIKSNHVHLCYNVAWKIKEKYLKK